jgi:hypothetical protein
MLLAILLAFNIAFVFLDDAGSALATQSPMVKIVIAFGLAVIEAAVIRYAMQRSPRIAQFFASIDRR